MDAFEEIVAGLFRQDGYWTYLNYKVKVSKDEKRRVGKPSLPRPEIDILAYKPSSNTLLWIECKSYLDSHGVKMNALPKVFMDRNYREVVSARLIEQVVQEGLTLAQPSLKYCLVAGHIHSKSLHDLREHFNMNGWDLFDTEWIRERLKKLAGLDYENDVAVIIAKLLRKDVIIHADKSDHAPVGRERG